MVGPCLELQVFCGFMLLFSGYQYPVYCIAGTEGHLAVMYYLAGIVEEEWEQLTRHG